MDPDLFASARQADCLRAAPGECNSNFITADHSIQPYARVSEASPGPSPQKIIRHAGADSHHLVAAPQETAKNNLHR